MIYEDWDEGYEPPESATYAGGEAPSTDYGDGDISLREQLNIQTERVKDLNSVIFDIRELLSRQHKLVHADFLTALAGIVSAAPKGKP